MKPFEFKQNVTIFGKNVILSQSGYTGEDGFEIYCVSLAPKPQGTTPLSIKPFQMSTVSFELQ
jgi:glycine cleavage system aminomethyltransferase T